MDERHIQKSYWLQHSADLSVEAMMLDSKAAHLDKEERPEVIALFFFSSTSYYYSHFILLFYLP